jgi:carboxyl-terminal processing protease
LSWRPPNGNAGRDGAEASKPRQAGTTLPWILWEPRVAVAHAVRLLPGFAALWLAAAPAIAAAAPANGAAPTDEAVFGAALATLQARHVEPQPPGQRMTAGLRALRGADPALAVTATPRLLELSFGAGLRLSLPAPPAEDAAAWGRTGAAAVSAIAAASPRIRALDGAARRALVLEEMAAGLDPFTRYVPPSEAAQLRTARLGVGGTGIVLQPDGAAARVARLEPEGPGWRAGLAPGDRVLGIDGAATGGRTAEDLARALSGEPGTAVTLSVSRRGGTARRVTVTRAAVLPQTARLSWAGGAPVITVEAFSRDTEQVVARIAAGLAARQPRPGGLVLDLRGNRGGLLPQAVGVADVFLEAGVVVHQRGRHPDASRTWLAGGADLAEGMPVVVLVDGGTASAAEAVAAALQDRGRARIVGSATRGKGLIQLVQPLPDGSELHVSWSRLFRPGGEALQDHGVVPEVCTSRGEAQARAEAEALLAQAAAQAELGSREASQVPRDRTACPPAQGAALDMQAALWLLRGSVAAPGDAGREGMR